MKGIEYVPKILSCCQKREEVLVKRQSIRKYNKYFQRMRTLARKLINENRQDELLPYLKSDSISIRRDIAGLLFSTYPEECTNVLNAIANQSEVPVHFGMIQLSAIDALKHGIPKDYP